MKQHHYRVVIEPAEEGGYTVFVPALPGCVTQGETYDEAVVMAKECIEGFLEALVKAGQPIPSEPEFTGPLTVAVSVGLPVPS